MILIDVPFGGQSLRDYLSLVGGARLHGLLGSHLSFLVLLMSLLLGVTLRVANVEILSIGHYQIVKYLK